MPPHVTHPATLVIDARAKVARIHCIKQGPSLLWMKPDGYPIVQADGSFAKVTFREPLFIIVNVAASLFFNLLSIPLPTFRLEAQFDLEMMDAIELGDYAVRHTCDTCQRPFAPETAAVEAKTPEPRSLSRRFRFADKDPNSTGLVATRIVTGGSFSSEVSNRDEDEGEQVHHDCTGDQCDHDDHQHSVKLTFGEDDAETATENAHSDEAQRQQAADAEGPLSKRDNETDDHAVPEITAANTAVLTEEVIQSGLESHASVVQAERVLPTIHISASEYCICEAQFQRLQSSKSMSNLGSPRPAIIATPKPRVACQCKRRGALMTRALPTLDMLVIKGSTCTATTGLLSPAYWALNINQFFSLVIESWRIVVSRDNTPDGYMELGMNFSFPTRGLLSSIVKHTWNRFVSKKFLQESVLFLRDFFAAVNADVKAYASSEDHPADSASAHEERQATACKAGVQARETNATADSNKQPDDESVIAAVGEK